MAIRRWAGAVAGDALSAGMARLNARHPWSHNDHFHSWIVANLPEPSGRRVLDLVTMVAVLHHLDVTEALREVRRRLSPGGRFLAVGLARPSTVRDHAWDVASDHRVPGTPVAL